MRSLTLIGCFALGLLHSDVSAQAVNYESTESPSLKPQEAEEQGSSTKTPDSGELKQLAGFDYYMLALTNTAALCRADEGDFAKSCIASNSENRWTIHGLWPNNDTGKHPANCDKTYFNISDLDPIRDQLEKVWPTAKARKNVKWFWIHEYTKHGSCALSALETPLNYFNTTMSLLAKVNISNSLREGKIEQSDDVSYSLIDVRNAIQSQNGGRNVQLYCVNEKDDDWLLAEVRLCMDKSFKPLNCPEKKQKPRRNRRQKASLPQLNRCPEKGIKYVGALSTEASTSGNEDPKMRANEGETTPCVCGFSPSLSVAFNFLIAVFMSLMAL